MKKLRLIQNAQRPLPAPTPIASAIGVPDAIRDRLAPIVLDAYSSGDFHRVDMRSLAKEAGMSFSTIYRYFGDKEALLFWFIDYWFRDLYPYAVEPLTSERSSKDALLECLRRHLAFYDKHPKVGRIVFLTVPLDRWMRDDTYHQHPVMSTFLSYFAQGQSRGDLRTDVSTVAMLDAFVALFNRSFLMWEYRRRKYSLVGTADETFQILWSGIAAATDPTKGTAKPRSRVKKS